MATLRFGMAREIAAQREAHRMDDTSSEKEDTNC